MGQLISTKSTNPEIYEFMVPLDNYVHLLNQYRTLVIVPSASSTDKIISTYTKLKAAHLKLTLDEKKQYPLPPLRL